MEIFPNIMIIHVSTVSFEQFNSFLLNKSKHFCHKFPYFWTVVYTDEVVCVLRNSWVQMHLHQKGFFFYTWHPLPWKTMETARRI